MKIFTEEQKFNQWWLYAVIGACSFYMILPIVLNADDIGSNIKVKISLLISILLITGAVLLIRMMTLHTRIDEKGIHYRFTPFRKKGSVLSWSDIENVYVRKYNAMTEFGVLGFKGIIFISGGKAFNVKGNKGIQIILKNGKKILIGTQKKDEAQRVLNVCKEKFLESTE